MKEMLNKSDVVGLSGEKFWKISLDFSVTVLIDGLMIMTLTNFWKALIQSDFLCLQRVNLAKVRDHSAA